MAQTAIRRPVTAKAWVHGWVSPCEICSGQSGTRRGFSQCSKVFPCPHRSTVALHTSPSSGG
jgi:hypothetical protein